MGALPDEWWNVRLWASFIEAAGGLLIAGYCVAAFAQALRFKRARAQRLVAVGALAALDFILCATLLKTLLLTSWQQIGIFASVLALRTTMKRIFAAEANRASLRV